MKDLDYTNLKLDGLSFEEQVKTISEFEKESK